MTDKYDAYIRLLQTRDKAMVSLAIMALAVIAAWQIVAWLPATWQPWLHRAGAAAGILLYLATIIAIVASVEVSG
jgi:hypothetical protein